MSESGDGYTEHEKLDYIRKRAVPQCRNRAGEITGTLII